MLRRTDEIIRGGSNSNRIHCLGLEPEFQTVSGLPSTAFGGSSSAREAEAVREADKVKSTESVTVWEGEAVGLVEVESEGQRVANPSAQNSTFPSIMVINTSMSLI